MLDLAAHVGEDLIHGMDLVITGIAGWNCQNFLIRLRTIYHVQHAYRTDFNQNTGKTGLLDENKAIDRIVVVGQGSGNEAVVTRVVKGRVERTVETENAEFPIIFVLICGVLGDLNDATDYFRGIGAGIKIVEGGHGSSVAR